MRKVAILYGRGGFELIDPLLNNEELKALLFNAANLLKGRGHLHAATLLKKYPFKIYHASNDFNDEFHVLFSILPLEEYEELKGLSQDDKGHHAFKNIADVITEIGPYIRFIAIELSMDQPDMEWNNIFNPKNPKHDQSGKKYTNKKIPVAVCAVVNEVLGGSHATLNAIFKRAGAPGEPPDLSHATKWKVWLIRANEDPDTDAHQVLGKVLEEFMEVEPPDTDNGLCSWLGQEFPNPLSLWQAKKKRVENVLERYGLHYIQGGRIVETKGGIASDIIADALRDKNFDSVDIEFRRCMKYIPDDPGAAITAGCSLLEALFKAYIDKNNLEMPSQQTIKPLWSIIQRELGLNPKAHTDADIQRILSGMSSIIDGIGARRTHAGSAHGGGKLRYRVKPRHARLLISSAHAMALFLIETWEDRSAVSEV